MKIDALVDLGVVAVQTELVSTDKGVKQQSKYYLVSKGRAPLRVEILFNPVTGEALAKPAATVEKK
jgi:hypothetical protein